MCLFHMACRSDLFAHYIFKLSSLCRHIWRDWVYKIIVWPFGCVSKIKSLPKSSFTGEIMWSYMFPAKQFLLWWSWGYVYYYYLTILFKSEILNFSHCLWLDYVTTICTVCLTMLLWRCFADDIMKYISLYNFRFYFDWNLSENCSEQSH